MDNLLKSTKLTTVFLCLLGFIQVEFHSFINPEIPSEFGGGHIETLGDMLIAETDNPIIVIEMLRIINENGVYSFQGCQKDKCNFDISNLVPGTYEAIISTNGGNIFSETIFIGN